MDSDFKIEEEYGELPDDADRYFEHYYSMLDAIEVMPKDELQKTILAAAKGDRQAASDLSNQYLKKAARLALEASGQGLLMEDLIGTANLALAEGIAELERYVDTENPGDDLIALTEGYLVNRMQDAIEAAVKEEQDEIESDQMMADQVNRVADEAARLSKEYMRKVTPEELAESTDLTVDEIRDVLRLLGNGKEDIDLKEE